MANLLSQLNSSPREQAGADTYVTTTDVDWSLRHFIIFIVLGALAGVLLSFVIGRFNELPTLGGVGLALLAAMVLLIVIIFQSFLIKSTQFIVYLALIEAGGLLVFLLDDVSSFLIIGSLCFVASLVMGHVHARSDLTNRLKVSFYRFARLVATSAITGIAIFTACLYAGLYKTADGVSFKAFQFLTAGSVPVVRGFVPTFSPEMTVDDFFLHLVRQQFVGSPQLAPLSEGEKTEVFRRLAIEFENRLAQTTKVAAEIRETVLSYFYRVSNRYLVEFSGNGTPYLPLIAIILTVYWIIKGVMFFAKWIVVGISMIIYQLLQGMGLVYLAFEPRKKEIVMIGGKKHSG